ncbi:asparagine synthase (glutamine-hydrolyzing) [Algoriphagus aquatilis]|uniref:asparagine synthase (glutamine-hydrolyzing) n=1 Tax=Algoriphagus aquatilis TaxID=490186 RepID=A0ABW0BTC4_9BACT
MCGVSGFVDFKFSSDEVILRKMTDSLIHRGPDDAGYFLTNTAKSQIGLGHRRLSILDLTEQGHQPMVFGKLKIIFNGEVYNFKEIRADLEAEGFSFDSNSDTEVILKAFSRWGKEMVHRLNGMFAIVIFDSEQGILTLIRDRAGVKPLYWYYHDGLFLFASELKSFHEHPSFIKEIDTQGLSLFFQYGYIPEPYTIFKNSFKLKAGHILEFSVFEDSIKTSSYWNVIDCYNKEKLVLEPDEILDQTETLLKSACEYRMVSDVPVGVFLSGGYDSSAVTALLQSSRTEKIKTFSIGFAEEQYNEAHHAKKIADFLGTDHNEYYCGEKDALEILPELPLFFDEPFADSSMIPTILVSRLAKQQVTVSLSADGGDELFGGYEKYLTAGKYFDRFSRLPNRKEVSNVLEMVTPRKIRINSMFPKFTEKYYRAISFMKSESQTDFMESLQKFFTTSELNDLAQFEAHKTLTGFDELALLSQDLSELDKMLALDFKTYQLDNILTKVDRSTMSISLEGREPLLDYRLIEFVSRIDSNYKIKNGNKKYLLKEITHKYIPKELLDRPKMGFSIPLERWLKVGFYDYMDYYFSPEKLKTHGLFNVSQIIRIKDQFLKGHDYLLGKVWTILVFQMWYEKWMK